MAYKNVVMMFLMFILIVGVVSADSLDCPERIGNFKLHGDIGEIEVDPSFMTSLGYSGTRYTKCSYMDTYDDFGRPVYAISVDILWFEEPTELNCGDYFMQGTNVWSNVAKVIITHQYLADSSLLSEMDSLSADMMLQAEARAVSCEGEGIESLVVPDSVVNEVEDIQKKVCKFDEKDFEKNWKKYSDLDERIEHQTRSYEAQQIYNLYEQMVERMTEAFRIEIDMEIDRLARLELREYRANIVQGLRVNLLKSFWRLSWVTYSTIKSGAGTGKSYEKFLTSSSGIARIGAGLKVIRSNIPKGAEVGIDTSSIVGKIGSVGLSGAIQALEEQGNPGEIAGELMKSIAGETLPSADLTEEDFEILREQHLTKRAIDEALQVSYKENAIRRQNLLKLEGEIEDLKLKISDWEAEEKERVRIMLECEEGSS